MVILLLDVERQLQIRVILNGRHGGRRELRRLERARLRRLAAVPRTVAVRLIRSERPGARVVGPSIGTRFLSDGSSEGAAGAAVALNQTVEFLRFARDNQVLPDVYSWHDATQGPSWKPGNPGNRPPLWIGNGSEVVDKVRQMCKLLGALDIERVGDELQRERVH